MASIIKKKVKKYVYYYLVESARVNGKPRIVNQKYLGTAENIGKAISASAAEIPDPEYSTVLEFGAVCALYQIAEKIGLRKIIDELSGKRNQGLSLGEYMLLAAINRAVSPVSKKEFYGWFDKTVLHKLFPNANKKNLSSQAFWDNMTLLDGEKLSAMEDAIIKVVVEKFNVQTDCLLYDNTNFFTYIDTSNPSTLAKRGNSKEKRKDLKIIGLSLMVSPDHNIPLFHETYPGNMNDAKRFTEAVDSLKKRYLKLGKGEQKITLVYDKGNNSDTNVEKLLNEDPCTFHVIGGLRLGQCKDLLEIPKERYIPLEGERFKGTSTYRTQKNIYKSEMAVIVTFNPELIKAQLDGIHGNIEKCTLELNELKSSLEEWSCVPTRRGRKPTSDSVLKNISSILSPEHMKDIFDYQIIDNGSVPTIHFMVNDENFESIKEKILGKSVIYTDHTNWDTEKIVSAYRSQYHVEECFRQMKDTKYLSFRPLYHWTDRTIRVHAFYCVLALLLSSLLNKEIEKIGHKMTVHKMIDELNEIKQVITVFEGKKKRISKVSLSHIDGAVKDIIEKLDLLQYQIKL